MKLTKDEIQKIVLAGMILAIVLYVYSTMLLGALTQREAGANNEINDLQPKVKTAEKQIAATRGLEQNSAQVTERLFEIKSLIPNGAPVAWFPPKMTDFFKRQGITKSSIKLTGDSASASLSGFKNLAWSIDLPQTNFVPLGLAIAALENENPLLEINSLQVDAGTENPGAQHATLTINTIVNQ
jgi:hypothetical protein